MYETTCSEKGISASLSSFSFLVTLPIIYGFPPLWSLTAPFYAIPSSLSFSGLKKKFAIQVGFGPEFAY